MGNLFSKKRTVTPELKKLESRSMLWVNALSSAYSKPLGEPVTQRESNPSKISDRKSQSSRASVRRGSYNGLNGESHRGFTHDDMIKMLRVTETTQRIIPK